MPIINLLDSSVYNRIAAGEVVQQPASVVKELLENSIDSGANNVTLEIKEGGIKEIRVTDNGCGIEKSDIKNAFLPHATSKVKTVDDLDSISTLGFRGEALSSIASVSIVEVSSKTAESDAGVNLSLRGGDYGVVEECSHPVGTTMCVQNIFFNTPARAKFLKKPYQEEAEVTNVIQKTIFANPEIAFTYVADGKLVYKSGGNGLLSAIQSVYGTAYAEKSLAVDYEKYDIRVKGYVCDPSLTKPNRNYQTIIINGRFIKDFGLSSVISNAFGDRLMKRSFPVFVLDIVIPFNDVDVNVHPAKTEVRFKKQSAVYGAVYNAVKDVLENHEKVNTLQKELTPITESQVKHDQQSFFNDIPEQQNFRQHQDTERTDRLIKELLNKPIFESHELRESSTSSLLQHLLDKSNKTDTEPTVVQNKITVQDTYQYDYLGQLFDCYILLQSGENFIIIDQHAAHERLLFDELMNQSNNKTIVSQPMLLPFTANYSPKDFARIMDVKESLQELGIDIEEFGTYTIKISALPLPLVGMNVEKFIDEFLKDFDNRTDFSYADLLKDKLASRACRSAIKAGDKLNKEQIDSIIKQILDSNMTLQCPHGRPVAIKYTKKDVEKLFKRIL